MTEALRRRFRAELAECAADGLRALKGWRLLPALAIGITVWLQMLAFPSRPTGPHLDDSWNSVLAHDLVTGAQFGTETIFTYGPLAHLFSAHPPFDARLFDLQRQVQLIGRAIAAWVFLRAVRGRHAFEQIAFAVTLLVLAPILHDTGWLLAACAMTLGAIDPRPRQPLRIAAGVAVLAVLAAAKFTLFLFAAAGVGLATAALATRRRWLAAAMLPIGYGFAFALVWTAAGQHLTNIPAYIRASLEITSGYTHSMALHGPVWQIAIAGAVLAAFAVQSIAAAVSSPRSATNAAATATVVTMMFLCWKAGFVRQDVGHIPIFFSAAALAPFLLPRTGAGWSRWLQAGAAAITVGASLYFSLLLWSPRLSQCLAEWRWHANNNISWLLDSAQRRAALVTATDQARAANALPEIRAIVGDHSIDILSFEQGLAFLNDLHLVHRPVPQSYSAYTPYLQAANGDFYAGPTAPDFVLAAIQPIDGHFPLAEDSGAWRALLHHYLPLRVVQRWLLLRRRTDVAIAPPAKITAEGRASFGQWVDLPAEGPTHELELQLAFPPAGRTRVALFRPPAIRMDVRLRNGSISTFEIDSCMVQAPFLIDPFIASTAGIAATYFGTAPRVAAFRLRSDAAWTLWLDGQFDYRIRTNDALVPSLATLRPEQQADVLGAAYPMFSPAPSRCVPEHPWLGHLLDKQPILLADPPARLEFDLPAGTHDLRATYGILDAAFTAPCETDGVTFRIQWCPAAGATQDLLQRFVDPRNAEGDRGVQSFTARLEHHPPGVLVMETDAGPKHDNRWDFAYWTNVSARSSDN